MAFKSTVELYSDLILPRLAEGPKTLEQLAVPAYALEKLQANGLVACRTYRVDALGVKVWFLKEDLDALVTASLDLPPRRHCWDLTEADYD